MLTRRENRNGSDIVARDDDNYNDERDGIQGNTNRRGHKWKSILQTKLVVGRMKRRASSTGAIQNGLFSRYDEHVIIDSFRSIVRLGSR